jgi:NDP-sugar pyrophosphorylase family protein
VRIGRHVTVGRGVRLEYTDVGDGADVREGARLCRSACGEGSIIGSYAQITDSYVGPMAEIRSERHAPACLQDFSAIGDGTHLCPGSNFSGISVYPRLRVPRIANLPAGTQLTSHDDILRWVS